MAESNGSTGENQNSRRLNQMRDVIQSMIDLVHEQTKASHQQHLETMEEIRELILLQKEQRIDIMALFQSQKDIRERMDKNDEGNTR